MITVQQTIRLVCDRERCNESDVITGFFPYDCSAKEILDIFLYENRYSGWHIGINGKLYCDHYCEKEDV